MSEPTKAPYIEPALIAWLERVFPNKVPKVTYTEREIWMGVGVQNIIANLRATSAGQQEDSIAERIVEGL